MHHKMFTTLIMALVGAVATNASAQNSATAQAAASVGAPTATPTLSVQEAAEVKEVEEIFSIMAKKVFPPSISLCSNLTKRAATTAWLGEGFKELSTSLAEKNWNAVLAQLGCGPEKMNWISQKQPSKAAASEALNILQWKQKFIMCIDAPQPLIEGQINDNANQIVCLTVENDTITTDTQNALVYEPFSTQNSPKLHPDGKKLLITLQPKTAEVFVFYVKSDDVGPLIEQINRLEALRQKCIQQVDLLVEKKKLGETTMDELVKGAAVWNTAYHGKRNQMLAQLLAKY